MFIQGIKTIQATQDLLEVGEARVIVKIISQSYCEDKMERGEQCKPVPPLQEKGEGISEIKNIPLHCCILYSLVTIFITCPHSICSDAQLRMQEMSWEQGNTPPPPSFPILITRKQEYG